MMYKQLKEKESSLNIGERSGLYTPSKEARRDRYAKYAIQLHADDYQFGTRLIEFRTLREAEMFLAGFEAAKDQYRS